MPTRGARIASGSPMVGLPAVIAVSGRLAFPVRKRANRSAAPRSMRRPIGSIPRRLVAQPGDLFPEPTRHDVVDHAARLYEGHRHRWWIELLGTVPRLIPDRSAIVRGPAKANDVCL